MSLDNFSQISTIIFDISSIVVLVFILRYFIGILKKESNNMKGDIELLKEYFFIEMQNADRKYQQYLKELNYETKIIEEQNYKTNIINEPDYKINTIDKINNKTNKLEEKTVKIPADPFLEAYKRSLSEFKRK